MNRDGTNSPDNTPSGDDRLDEIATQWTLIRRAHSCDAAADFPDRNALVLRYHRAIRRYVGALVRDEHDADEVANDAILRLLRGDFGRATPERGRFRDFLKVAVKNMVRNFWTRQQRRTAADIDPAALADPRGVDEPAADDAWETSWRTAVLDVAWRNLADHQQQTTGSVAHTLLRLRAQHPEAEIVELAELLKVATGRTHAPAAVRQQLRRARLRFAQLLLDELAESLAEATPERVEQELIDLGLMKYVRDFLPADWRTSGRLIEVEE